MNRRDLIGIVHACTPESGPDEGRTQCGQNWVTFQSSTHRQGTPDEIDCMACIERSAALENLRTALDASINEMKHSVKKWRRDPLHIMWSPVPARIDVLDGDTVAITIHDGTVAP